MDRKGFTLIEVLVTIAILSILSMIAITAYIGQEKRAARSEAYTNLQNLRLLEEQYMAENGTYAPNPAANLGTCDKDQPNNVTAIRNSLPGFNPGSGLSYSYCIDDTRQITNPNTTPVTTAAVGAAPCFIAYAYGNSGVRVAGDVFAIDCNNNRNF